MLSTDAPFFFLLLVTSPPAAEASNCVIYAYRSLMERRGEHQPTAGPVTDLFFSFSHGAPKSAYAVLELTQQLALQGFFFHAVAKKEEGRLSSSSQG